MGLAAVFAVPGPITSDQSTGTNQLLRHGAIPFTGMADILEILPRSKQPIQATIPTVSDDERTLLETLEYPLHIDDLARRLGLVVPTVSSRLLQLELKGLVTSLGGKIFERNVNYRLTSD